MRKTLTSALLAALLVLAAFQTAAWAQGATAGHEGMTPERAAAIIKPVLGGADAKIIDITKGPLGLWQIAFVSGGRSGVLYIDAEAKYAFGGQFIDLTKKEDITKKYFESLKDKFEAALKIDVSQIPLKGSIILGDAKAKYKVIVFDDPD